MFIKDDNLIKRVELNIPKMYNKENILLTNSFALMMSSYHESKLMQEQMDYQEKITTYHNKKHENNIKKLYNPKIVNLYDNGLLLINNDEHDLKNIYIVFDDKKNDFHIKDAKHAFNNDGYDYNKAVKFIDTTAFISLINSSDATINNNRIIINNIDVINNIINNWDGYLHRETKETDAIINNKMIRDDVNE